MSQFEGIEVLDYSGPNYKALTALFRRQARGHEEKEVPVFAIICAESARWSKNL
jgi:hypothetical protein